MTAALRLPDRADLLAGGFVMTFASSFGQTWFIALSGPDLRAELGLTHGGFGSLYAAATLLSGMTLLWAGGAVDRLPTRRVALATMTGLGLSCLGMAAVRHPLALVAVLFGLRLCGQGLLSHVALTTIARGFPIGRGRALSLASLGFPAAEALLPIAVAAAIATIGWRQTWTLGGSVALVALPGVLWLLLRHAPTPAHVRTPGAEFPAPTRRRDLLRSARFALLLPAMLTTGFIVTALFFHQGAFSAMKGWPPGWFAACIPAYAATSVAAILLSGHLVDRYGARKLLPLFVLPLVAGMVLLAASDQPVAALAALAMTGLTAGASNTAVTAGLAEVYGIDNLGTVRALGASAAILASAASPALVGIALDAGVPGAIILLAFALLALAASPLAARGVGYVQLGQERT